MSDVIRFILREYSDSCYSLDTQNTQDTGSDTDLADARICLPPSGLVLTSDDTAEIVVGGVRMTRVHVAWTASPDPFLEHYEIRHRPTAASEWVLEPNVLRTLLETYTVPVDDTVQHTVEVRAVNTLGVASAWVSGTTTPSSVFYEASITQLSGEFVGDRLWATVSADIHTRTTGISIIGRALTSGDTVPTLADHAFAVNASRFGHVDTGLDFANPGEFLSTRIKLTMAAVNGAGDVGSPVAVIVYRTGAATVSDATIDTFTQSKVQGGTACGDPAQSSVQYVVTSSDPTDTVTIERWVDGVLEATILSASTTHSNTLSDDHAFFEDPPSIMPVHDVMYHLIAKTSGGTVIVDQWTSDVTYSGVVDCP